MNLIEAQHETLRALESGRRVMDQIGRSRVGRGYNAVPDSVRGMASAISDPARFWAAAASGSVGGDAATAELTAAAIRAAAAKLKIGDMTPIREALIGQAQWLAATAVRLMALTAEVEPGGKADERRAELTRLALKASEQSAKILASAVALEAIKQIELD